MREWITRVVSGYWTHAGYMNWDSGLGFDRWHQGKKFGLTQEALIGLASSDTLLPARKWGQWAKSMLDNGFDFYARLSARSKDGLAGPACSSTSTPSRRASAAPGWPRRACRPTPPARSTPGSGQEAATPPPLYAYDPDIGRLAVTTPTYNTAIVAVNQKAFPYGGLDLARLYDGQQEVAANIGGRPPASFGLLVRDVGGRRVTASQVGRARVVPGVRPLRLTKAPRGAGAVSSVPSAAPTPARSATCGRPAPRAARGLLLRVTHRFTRDWIQTTWTATRRVRQRPLHRRRAVPELARRRQRRGSSRCCATARA